ncbi:MAG: phenylalanine--tRNA ligase subunit beta [Gemmataceae bacterium]
MKVPLNWLRDYVDISLPVAELAERLTMAGLEVAGIQPIGLPVPEGVRVREAERGPVWDRDKIVVAEVLGVEQHPNADRLVLATVHYGADEPKTVVTGAPNIKVGEQGQKVILALRGAVLFDGHSETKVLRELKPSKIRGVPSDAMVCSEYELGISEEHEGVIILEADAPVGMPLADFMGDIVLDIDVLPNMARCLSLIGVAREVAALTGQPLRLPPHVMQATGKEIAGQVEVVIEDVKLSARYAAALIEGVTIGPAPGWMQRRLSYAGMRPISNIVDITNYVMLEWGQPLHAFDWDLLRERAHGKTPTIIVRPARPGERLTTLDGQKRELTAEHLVIADTAGPIALAGVMGGADTEVTDQTKSILLESANFDYVSIRRTMRAFNLPSEASVRFSKGIHPATARPAAERAAELMRQHARGTLCQGLVDSYPAPVQLPDIRLDMKEVRRQLGVDLARDEAARILRALEFHIEEHGAESLCVTAPPHRLDIQAGSADLIEEIVRIHGYDRLPATLLDDQLPEQHTNRSLVLEERVRDILVQVGLQEVITYSLTMPEREAPLGLAAGEYVELLNPISNERRVMRRDVLASVLDIAAANLRHASAARLFEIGYVYLPQAGASLPDERNRLAIVMTGRREPEFWGNDVAGAAVDFFDLKGVIESLTGDLHLSGIDYQRSSVPYLHPGKAADLLLNGQTVGSFGQLHPKVAEAYEITGRDVLVAELDLDAMLAAVPERFAYTPLPRFPAALRDIAVIVDEALTAERVAAEIRASGGNLLRDIRLFDLYRGESIPTGTKSLAYALTYQADDRTLTDKEVDKAHKKIADRLKHVLQAKIRGEAE